MSAIGGNNHRADFSSYTSQKGLSIPWVIWGMLSQPEGFSVLTTRKTCVIEKYHHPTSETHGNKLARLSVKIPEDYIGWHSDTRNDQYACVIILLDISDHSSFQFLNFWILTYLNLTFSFYLKEVETSYKNSCSVCTCTFHFVHSLFICTHHVNLWLHCFDHLQTSFFSLTQYETMVDVILFVVSWSQKVVINFMSLLLHHICQLGKRIQEQQRTGDSSTHYAPVLVSCIRDDTVIGYWHAAFRCEVKITVLNF